ncbi:243_t:CDS:2 [Ambispora leptoticha]|uniref:243_t:CDS:1 n=1 Tax=Ambispora leptoticha TaxID=144679 RepID=A0A9N9NBQ4_9GLOM|nr:243_t:CDS:2 [Ambispora leptoticha]
METRNYDKPILYQISNLPVPLRHKELERISESKNKINDNIKCYLDDYVPFSNGNYKHIDFEKIPSLLYVGALLAGASSGPSLSEGSHIAIDINMTRNYIASRNFDSRHDVRQAYISNNLPGEGGFQELVGGITEARERHARANE